MSNLSDIGFSVSTQEEFTILLERAVESGQKLETAGGLYVRNVDLSGAELWLQFEADGDLIGMNPHFRGKSRVPVALERPVRREQSHLDGGWLAWVNPSDPHDPESGDFPFVFDCPDFELNPVSYPGSYDIQLTAFSQEITFFPGEDAFMKAQQEEEIPFASQSFIPVGLIGPDNTESPEAQALITGIIREVEDKKNQFSGQWFTWILLETLGVTLDLVVDRKDLPEEPFVGGVIQCQVWLSGQVLK